MALVCIDASLKRMESDFPMIFNSQRYRILKAASKSVEAMIKYL